MRRLIALVLCAGTLLPATAITLYDASGGQTPQQQGWFPLASGTAPSESVAGGRYLLDTRADLDTRYGNARISPFTLDTAAGFDLSFNLRVDAETHASVNRAGYSVVVVGDDRRQALELSFWTDHVWAADYVAADPDRFVHGVDAAFDTTVARDYRLAVRNDAFVLSAGGTTLLTGALRDYTAEGLPYTVRNFVFFGDDTTRGAAATGLAFVGVTAPVPEPATALLLAAGVGLLAVRRRVG